MNLQSFAARSPAALRRENQRANATPELRRRALRLREEQLRAAPLVVGVAGLVDGIVEPERDLDGVAIVEARRDLVEVPKAIVDVAEIVELASRGREPLAKVGVHRRRVR